MTQIKKIARKAALKVLPGMTVARVRKIKKTVEHWKTRYSRSTYLDLSQGTPEGPGHPEPRFNLRVASIMDEFSYTAWQSEFHLVPITPDGWKQQLNGEIDFLFVESAWAGNDSSWQYQLTGPNAPSHALQEVVAWCKDHEIPTTFWNKEDPPHFEDFLDTAKLFDVIFTTDENKIAAYKDAVGHERVIALPFAAQPFVHNPARNGIAHASSDVAFAGTYFRHKFPERRAQMDLLIGAAANEASSGRFNFTIFSRHSGGEEKYQFPKAWERFVIGSLPYSRMLAAYKSFKVFLNVNSVVNSPSMCARRIFEITASGTAVLTTPSEAIRNFFPADEIAVAEDQETAGRMMRALVASPQLRDRMVHRAQRRVWENHTYEHRAQSVLNAVGITHAPAEFPMVSVICSTNRDGELDHLLNQVAQQVYSKKELLVLGHGISIDKSVMSRAADRGINLRVFHAPPESTLGECLNTLVAETRGEIIAKFDDDDYYLPNYLRDQVNALHQFGADLVGKASIFFQLQSSDAIAVRWPQKEHIWTNFVAGATLVGWRETFSSCPFAEITRGEDSAFLRSLEQQGKKVYSADRFNYMAVRNMTKNHTWSISDAEILSYSKVETFGDGIDHVAV